MPTYDESLMSDVALDNEKPVPFQLLRAFRDNLKAVAEVSAGAPRLAVKSLVGEAAVGANVVFSGLDEFKGLVLNFVHYGITVAENGTSYIEFSDNGSTWYGTTQIGLTTGLVNISGYGVVDFATGSLTIVENYSNGAGLFINTTVAGLTDSVTHVRFVTTTHAKCAVIAHPNGGHSVL